MDDERTFRVCPLSMADCVMEHYDEADSDERHPVCAFADCDMCMVRDAIDSLGKLLAQLADGWQEHPLRVEVG